MVTILDRVMGNYHDVLGLCAELRPIHGGSRIAWNCGGGFAPRNGMRIHFYINPAELRGNADIDKRCFIYPVSIVVGTWHCELVCSTPLPLYQEPLEVCCARC